MNVARRNGRVLRIGHRGAPALAPENTLRSFEHALELGADVIEFDVVPRADGTLVLAHSDELVGEPAPEASTLDEALGFLSAAGVGLHLDLKRPGKEAAVAAALRAHGVQERTLVSSFDAASLRALAEVEPDITRGLTYPFDRHGISKRLLLAPALLAGLGALRAALPRRIGGMLDRAGASAAVLHYSVVSTAAVARCHARGAAVVVWTIDSPGVLRRLVGSGVDAVITNDLGIFV